MWQNLKEQKLNGFYLKVSIVFNLINLATFKYFYFFTDIFNLFLESLAFSSLKTSIQIILPLAISFYTFQLIALQVDIYYKKEKEPISIKNYFLFILFFPQLIAGPIMRTKDFLPNVDKVNPNREQNQQGIFLIFSGLFKKVVIADSISQIISPLYIEPSNFNSISLLLGSFGFLAQIYCDFSGYTDIARGCAKLLGYEIPENFVAPLLSSSFKEFWQRWHITLSTWLRDYLYFPLGGSKKGLGKTYCNLVITMSLGGLWHGANINFLLWGFLMGLVMILERPLHKRYNFENKFVYFRVFFIFITYSLISLITVLFRSATGGEQSLFLASQYYFSLLSNINQGETLFQLNELISWIILSLIFNFLQLYKKKVIALQVYNKYLIPTFSIMMLFILGVFSDVGDEFIYFQF